MQLKHAGCAALVAASLFMTRVAVASPEEDRRIVAGLDTEFQAAVKVHDVATIDRIQHPDMVLVLGDGQIVTKADHLQAAREKKIHYEIQDEEPGSQTVRVSGDTAVVTALLRLKGTNEGAPFDRLVWFSDTYVRTPGGLEVFLRPGVAEAAGRGGAQAVAADAAAIPCGARRTRSCRARRAAPRRRRRSGAGSRTT